MSESKDEIRLRHMLDYSREAIALLQSKTRSDLCTDRVLQLALVRLIEIVGEAAGRVSHETQSQHPEIPWPQMISMRNRLIHGYDFVDIDILWQTIHEDLPPLVSELKNILPK